MRTPEMIKDKLKGYGPYLAKFQAEVNAIVSKAKDKFGQPKSIIGLDIGATSVKVAQMVNVDGELTLAKTAIVDIEAKKDEDMPAVTLATLKKALTGMNTEGAKVISVVKCPRTCVIKISIPHMPKQELAEAVRWEAKNYIPFSLDKAIFDFSILGEVIVKGVKKLNVAVAAAPRETIDNQLSIFSKVGIKLQGLIPISIALQNLIMVSKLKPDEIIATVEMGASITELNIYRNHRLEFSRKLPVSGQDFTKSLTGALISDQGKVELTIEEAERIKKQWGLPLSDKREMVEGKIATSQILSLIRPLAEHLVNEIGRSLDFYREALHGGKVDKIVLFGGSAELKGLTEFLGNELGIEVKMGNTLEGIKVSSAAVAQMPIVTHRLDLAIGAALDPSSLGNKRVYPLGLDDGRRINLLPVEFKEETKRFIEKISLKAIATVVIMLLLLFYIGMRIQSMAYEKRFRAANLEYRTLSLQFKGVRQRLLIGRTLLNRPYWQDALKDISNTIPYNIYLINLSMENNTVNLKGVITQKVRSAEAILSDFMLALEKGIFKNVSLVTTRKKAKDPTISEFEIKCEVD